MSKTFFISDLHFGHRNALAFDNRPYSDIETHDEDLIKRWNSTVSPSDHVWILGDISWHNVAKTIGIFKSLNGIKHLCTGNHDTKLIKNKNIRALFVEICDYKELEISQRRTLVLSHYPMPCFNKHYYGSIHFYGHVHSSFEWNMMEHFRRDMEYLYAKPCNMINVGCMMPYINYTPQTAKSILLQYEEWKKSGNKENMG